MWLTPDNNTPQPPLGLSYPIEKRNLSPSQSPAPVTTPSSSSSSSSSKIVKRQLNTQAARRYRQKRVDQVSSLEAALKAVQDERDALKVRVARLEGETDTLKKLLEERK
jgi:hypothetical protein